MSGGKLVAVVLPALVLGGAAAVLAFSPYRYHEGHDHQLLKESTDALTSCAHLFAWLGDSSRAAHWSVFVDHIVPLNPDVVPDGAEGSIRRSFRQPDEAGMRWDEHFTIVEPGRRRRLRIYDVREAPVAVSGELLTEQLYEPLEDGGCRLSFTLFFADDPSRIDHLKMRLGAWEIGRIFRKNIANVARLSAES